MTKPTLVVPKVTYYDKTNSGGP